MLSYIEINPVIFENESNFLVSEKIKAVFNMSGQN